MREPSRRSSALSAAALACALAVAAIPSAVGTPAPVASGAVESERTPAELNPLANRTWGVYRGSGDQAWTPYQRARGKKKQLLAKIALAPKAKWYGQWIPQEPDRREGPRPHHQRAGGRSRGAGADDRLPPQAVGGGGVPTAPDGQGAAGLQEVDRQVRGRDRCRPRRAGAAARRAVRPVRAGWVAAAVAAGRLRLARLQRPAQRQRLHRRGCLRLAAQRPGEGAEDPGSGGYRHRTRLRPELHPLRIDVGGDRVRGGGGAGAGRRGVRRQALRREHRVQRRAVQRLRLRRPELRQRRHLQGQGPAGVRDARHPADHGRRQPRLGSLVDRRGQRGGVRRRLPVDRPALVVHAGRPVRPQAGARGRRTTPY